MDAWYELNIRTQMEGIICRREGMIAENKQREHLGQSMAFTGDSFARLDVELMRLNDELRNHG